MIILLKIALTSPVKWILNALHSFNPSMRELSLWTIITINEERTVFSKNGSGIIGHPYEIIRYYIDFTTSKLTHNGTWTICSWKTIKCPE